MTSPEASIANMSHLAELYDLDVVLMPSGQIGWVAAVLHTPNGLEFNAFPGAGPSASANNFGTSLPELSLPSEVILLADGGADPRESVMRAIAPGKVQQLFSLAGVSAKKICIAWQFLDEFQMPNQSDSMHFVLDDGYLYRVSEGRFVASASRADPPGRPDSPVRIFSAQRVENYLNTKDCPDWPLLTLTELVEIPAP